MCTGRFLMYSLSYSLSPSTISSLHFSATVLIETSTILRYVFLLCSIFPSLILPYRISELVIIEKSALPFELAGEVMGNSLLLLFDIGRIRDTSG